MRRRRGAGGTREGREEEGVIVLVLSLPVWLHPHIPSGTQVTVPRGTGWRAERLLTLPGTPMESAQKSSEGAVFSPFWRCGNSLREHKV